MRFGILALTLTLVSMLAPAALVAADDAPPNIIFFLSDDQRADFLGCAGHPILKTPNIDRLARQGVRYSNMFVTTSICAASRATILTGLYERTHGYTFGTLPIRESHAVQSYPAVLKKAGYRTGFVGKFGVGVEGKSRQQMFDFFHGMGQPFLRKTPDGKRHISEIAGDKAIEFLEMDTQHSKPFCLSVSFNAPHAQDADKVNHYPWPQAMDGLYDDVEIPSPRLSAPEVFESQPEFLKNSLNRARWFWRWDTPEKYQRNVRAYYRMISGVDHVIGRVLQRLDELKLADNTIVVFSGDNGYYKGARGFAGKWSHYEESLRVPLVVYDPRMPTAQRGRVVDDIVLNVDLAATFIDMAKTSVPEHYQGQSLMAATESRTDFFCEHLFDHGQIPKWEGVRDSRYVYARYFEQQPAFEFLHDLEADPDQLKNFAGDPNYAEQLQRLRKRCDELRDAMGGEFDGSRVLKRIRAKKK